MSYMSLAESQHRPAIFPSENNFNAIDKQLNRLTLHKTEWSKVSIPQRIHYLHQCIAGVMTVAQQWAEAARNAKGIALSSQLVGEEWIAGPVATLLYLRAMLHTLTAQGKPQPVAITVRPDGQTIAQVFPDHWMDRMLWRGFSAEVWMEPGHDATQGLCYRRKSETGRLCLVLGAGNIAAISALDTLYKLFAEDQVVILKMNPVNAYIGPFLEHAFQPLIKDGFLAIAYGGIDVGQYLCSHPAVDTLHMTGSHHTHDAILWGNTSEEQSLRKTTHQPRLAKPITSELGCVTPVLVVPGKWKESDLRFQARHIASMVAHNASFNCLAAKVVVTAKDWPQRDSFLNYLRQALRNIPPRKAYYPGTMDRYQTFLAHYPQAELLGGIGTPEQAPVVPWTLIPDVPVQPNEWALSQEAFCGVLTEVSLDAVDAESFLKQAVLFANETLWGNLSCVVLISTDSQRTSKAAFEQAIADLRYGAIGVNTWTGINFLLPAATWGAFPGNPADAIQSGTGVVHNAYLFEHPQKSVVSAPFRQWTTPIYFADHKNLRQLAQRFAQLQVKPNWQNFLAVALAAVRG